MAVLNSWQRIDRVVPGKPWGDGHDGDATISADPNTRTTFTGSAAASTGTAGNTSLQNGDLVKIVQEYGSGAGQWEWNMVISGGGTTSPVFKKPLHYTYGTGAQIIVCPQYEDVVISNFTITAFNNTQNGHAIIVARKSADYNGTVNGNGANGGLGQDGGGQQTGGGFKGGVVGTQSNTAGQGQGTGGVANSRSQAANGTGGGGGSNSGDQGGGGGGNGSSGATDSGTGGSATGSADLTNMTMGGGGGGGHQDHATDGGGAGGNGGACFEVWSKVITRTSGGSNTNGGQGYGGSGNQVSAHGGDGAGGSQLFVGEEINISGINAVGGDNTLTNANGGNGRVACHYSKSVSITSSPSSTNTQDVTLVEKGGGAFFNLI